MSADPIAARGVQSSALDAFLAEVRPGSHTNARGRLIFGLDATASRKPTWDLAASLQAEMFRTAAAVGSLDLQLVFYRGDAECKATSWLSDPARLAQIMSRIDCRAGMTQIEKILAHARKETTLLHVGALVFIGDAVEESVDVLIARARELGRLKTPCFMFQEGRDSEVESAFRDIARNTGGAYGQFGSGSAKQLSELLRAVALFTIGGAKALEGRKDAGSVFLIDQLRDG
jgi:hypothetical protein